MKILVLGGDGPAGGPAAHRRLARPHRGIRPTEPPGRAPEVRRSQRSDEH
jgi:hypothetical protein